MGVKLKSKTHLLNTFLAPFLAHLAWKFEKNTLWPKKIFLHKIKEGLKKSRISCWFQTCWKSLRKMHKKAKQVWQIWVTVEKVNISVTFLTITFLWYIFKSFSTDWKTAWNSAFFLYPYWIFERHFFPLISIFSKLLMQMRCGYSWPEQV